MMKLTWNVGGGSSLKATAAGVTVDFARDMVWLGQVPGHC